jgi:hypothetical protein
VETTRANRSREPAGSLIGDQRRMQENSFSDLSAESNQVAQAANQIKTDVLTLDQKSAVKEFFRESADLLEKMNQNPPNN